MIFQRKNAVITGILLFATVLLLASCKSVPETISESKGDRFMPSDDSEFLWLEDVLGDEALEWVELQNQRSLEQLKANPTFEPLHQRALEILTSEQRLAYPKLVGESVTNFWRDSNHERGIWRRTSTAQYRSKQPAWETLLDVDRLAKKEDQNWVWSGASCRHPDYSRCFISLSIGGADATVKREFDLTNLTFVNDGFSLPESKSFLAWRDDDSVFLSPAFDDDEVTTSGYPRRVYLWDRGTDRQEATLIYEASREDMLAYATRVWDGETPYDFVVRMPGFYTMEYFLYRDGVLNRLDIPEDARVSAVIKGQLVVKLRSDWTYKEEVYGQGSLIAADFESLLAGSARFETLFQPQPRQSVEDVSTTENTLIISVLDNVIGKLIRYRFDEHGWQHEELDVPTMGSVDLLSTSQSSDQFYYRYTGFLTPTSIFEADSARNEHTSIRSEPAWFDAEGMEVTQYEASSPDGTVVPYFVITAKGFEAHGKTPTLLYGYGGFEVSMTPFYSGVMGSSWLEQGGVYVLANIRGGGEFGPAWHQAALKANRQRAFDDFIAVAEDLIERQITSPEHLGIRGGSNGGLLVAAVMAQRPELFGAVVCEVPLLDMQRYHQLLAGASWMAEYGNPDNPDEWAYLSAYSPFHNVHDDGQYPKAFFTTSTRDDRVHPGHARRMVAKMLHQGHNVLYYENIEGGHGGAANQRQLAFIQALTYSYLHEQLGQ